MFAGCAAKSADDLSDFVFNDQCREIFVCEALPWGATRVIWRWELLQHLVVKEVGEWSVAHVMQQSSYAQRLYNEPLAWDRIATRAQLFGERTV